MRALEGLTRTGTICGLQREKQRSWGSRLKSGRGWYVRVRVRVGVRVRLCLYACMPVYAHACECVCMDTKEKISG